MWYLHISIYHTCGLCDKQHNLRASKILIPRKQFHVYIYIKAYCSMNRFLQHPDLQIKRRGKGRNQFRKDRVVQRAFEGDVAKTDEICEH